MSKIVVISGVNGFVGRHLARELQSRDVTVYGIGTDAAVDTSIQPYVDHYYQADLTELWPDTGEVDAVIHLAGLAAVGPSFDEPQKYITVNSSMVTNLCEYSIKQAKKPRIIIVSSGAIYSPHQPLPISEQGEIGLSSPYAVSKVLTENQATYYRVRGLECVVVRPFNHIGPGQGKGFILPDFYERIKNTTENSIKVGNITTKRDYTDVRDIADAYAMLALASSLQSATYNVCSGRSLSGNEILDLLKQAMHRNDITFQVDKSLVRPTDIPDIIGDSSRLSSEFGWRPTHAIADTIRDFVAAKDAK